MAFPKVFIALWKIGIEKVGTKDLAFQEELNKMSAMPNYTAMTIEKMRCSQSERDLFEEHLDIL